MRFLFEKKSNGLDAVEEFIKHERNVKQELLSREDVEEVLYWVCDEYIMDSWSDIKDAIDSCNRKPGTSVERCVSYKDEEEPLDWEVVYDYYHGIEV